MKLGEQKLAVALIDDRESIQSRREVSAEAVSDYSRAMEAGDVFPAIVVFFDGKTYRIADGVHRYSAVIAHNGTEILADVREGGRLEALLHAVGANAVHGLRRTNKDKSHAVGLLLAEPACNRWSDRDIAKRCGVSHTFVSTLRRPDDAPRGNGCHASTGNEGCPLPSTGRQPMPSVAIQPAPTESSVVPRNDEELHAAARLEGHATRFLEAFHETSPTARRMARPVLDGVLRQLSRAMQETAA